MSESGTPVAQFDEATARIQILRWQVETAKAIAMREQLGVERDKLFIEALKRNRERWWYPFVFAVAASSATAVVIKLLG